MTNEKLIESVRDIPTITRLSHVVQIEKIGELRDALIAAEKAHTPTDARECGFMGCGSPRCAEVCTPELHPEPSDAQVEAAGALLYGISWGTDIADPDLVRDALRAAGEVKASAKLPDNSGGSAR